MVHCFLFFHSDSTPTSFSHFVASYVTVNGGQEACLSEKVLDSIRVNP